MREVARRLTGCRPGGRPRVAPGGRCRREGAGTGGGGGGAPGGWDKGREKERGAGGRAGGSMSYSLYQVQAAFAWAERVKKEQQTSERFWQEHSRMLLDGAESTVSGASTKLDHCGGRQPKFSWALCQMGTR